MYMNLVRTLLYQYGFSKKRDQRRDYCNKLKSSYKIWKSKYKNPC